MMKKHSFQLVLVLAFLAGVFSGCWQNKFIFYRDIIGRPSSTWKEHDCRAVIETHTEYNKYDTDAPVRIVATELSPLVMQAINRQDQQRKGWTEEEYQSSLYEGVYRYLGLTVKTGSDSLYDANGHPYKNETQLDSLVFLVSILQSSTVSNAYSWEFLGPLFELKNFVFYDPDLTDLKDQIFLQNGQGMLLKPNWVGAKAKGELIRKESFVVMFQLQQPSRHFLEDSKSMTLVIRGFERDTRLRFLVAPTDN